MKKTTLLGLPIYDKPSEDKFKLNDWNIANENIERAFSSAINGKSLDIVNTEVAEARGGEVNLKSKIGKIDASLEQIEKLNLINICSPQNGLTPVLPNGIDDNRGHIQTIINYANTNGFEGIYIPYNINPYRINVNHTGINVHKGNGLQIPSNFKVVIHPNAILKALNTTFTFHVMFNIYDAKNVEIIGGTLEGERLSHGSNTNEYGYGLYICGSENVTVKNVISKNWWGDCFTTRDIDTKVENNYLQPCKNIVFDNVVADNGCRQGLSIISGKNVKIKNSTFKNTNGTAPQSGVDLEPNFSDENKKLENVLIENCIFENNVGYGIVGTNTANLTIRNCTLQDSDINIGATINNYICENNTLIKSQYYLYGKFGVVKDNTIKECDTVNGAFYLDKKDNSSLIIKGNTIFNCVRAIVFASECNNISFEDNIFSGCTTNVINSNAISKNIVFNKNIFELNKGLTYFRLKNSIISNNVFRDNETGIYHDGGEKIVIQNNVFDVGNNVSLGTGFVTISSSVIGTILEGNKFYASINDNIIPIAITSNSNRTMPIIVKNNISMKATTVFSNPPQGTIIENNYSV